MLQTAVHTRIVSGFDDPRLDRRRWNELVAAGDTKVPYLTWEFQRAWWEMLGDTGPELHLVVGERLGEPVAVAPFFVESNTAFFVGTSFEYDYLDFVGDVSDPHVLEALLRALLAKVPGLRELDLFFVPARSRTAATLARIADRLDLELSPEDEVVACELDLVDAGDAVRAATNGRHALKSERWLARQGRLEVRHFRDGEEILDQLPAFFAQHRRRYPTDENPSRFLAEPICRLFERLAQLAGPAGNLRFTRIDLDARPIAFHYGYAYDGRWFLGPCSFLPELASRSPGKVLLRHVLLAAIDDGARGFDFGTGDQEFKLSRSTGADRVREWSLVRGVS